MREILFRGKRADNGVQVEGRLIADEAIVPKGQVFYISDNVLDSTVYACIVIPETVGQYTGLKDKNGKRVFEGDICQHEKTGRTISVSWHGTMAGYVWSKRIEDSHLFDFGELFRVHDKYAVIGNIHDNPELLEVR